MSEFGCKDDGCWIRDVGYEIRDRRYRIRDTKEGGRLIKSFVGKEKFMGAIRGGYLHRTNHPSFLSHLHISYLITNY
jgi:hypothetical protein